ncbi:MAG TPA: hypothetical protein VFV67_05000 [Actinophytocola sp.]|uniref:hypothetical protein n=1 Tax=Actinophytocola sp. TaxID=1872138 RepID=UPI002DB639CB|nr:hypothetical protein [Actinophytocola sp.]HEU5469989.1 hypothetical protein [Actinophytocola sp.]
MDGWDWYDYRQDRQIGELQSQLGGVEASLHAARRSTKRLQSELAKVSGSLEQRLGRLATAFDAFVELSDLRMTLTLFDAHARVRHRARQMFGEHPLPGELSDVDDYWLAPALSALQAVTDGTPPDEALALARSRDAHRAALFHVLGTALLGRPDAVTEAMVADALPELDASPLLYQRAVWLLAADGALGAGARERVLRLGVDRLAALDQRVRSESVTAWRAAVKPDRPISVPRPLVQATALINALDAGERLAVLRTWVADALEQADKPAPEVDIAVKHSLQLLVDEGSPLELPLLTRERELRKVIESSGTVTRSAVPDGWESPVDSLVALLRADVVDDSRPGRRALAIRISAAHVIDAAEALATQARTPIPDEVEARTSGGPVKITEAGPDERSVERAVLRRLDRRDLKRRQIAFAALGVAAFVVMLAAFAGWGWLLVAGIAVGVAGYQLRRDRADKERARESEVQVRAAIRAEAEKCVADYVQLRRNLVLAQAHLEDNVAALRAVLTGP